ncbi:MAG TPA: C39 family peptidase [Chloroflexota bacterium]|nr:C39 family peptidase [Chloroflexota bacterium]HUM67704.1 C39 family peptidase [Chloroflexota bacterium]
MKRRTKFLILALVMIQLMLIAGLLVLEPAVRSIPGRYRVALQERVPVAGRMLESVIHQVAPVAAALPAAGETNTTAAVDINALIAVGSTAVATDTPAPTPELTEETATSTTLSAGVSQTDTAVPQPTPQPTNTPIPTPTQTPTPEPLPVAHVLNGMGVIKQAFNNCGPANLTQVLNWYGSDITQEDIASYLKPNPEDRNVSPWQIADYVNQFTAGQFIASAHSGGTQELVKRLVAAGYPVVIEKGYEVNNVWYGHYLTVYGYDDELAQFYTQDTNLGPWDGSGRPASYEEVSTYWPQFNYTFYVVYKPEQEAEVQAILGPDMVDREAMWRQAAAMAQAEIDANPNDAFAWFNLGTNLTELGAMVLEDNASYYQAAVQAFDKARELGLPPHMLWYQHKPYLAYSKVDRHQDVLDLANATLLEQGGRNVEETYWYKGNSLAYQGDLYGAKEAYLSALAVNKNFYSAQISLDWVNSVLSGN